MGDGAGGPDQFRSVPASVLNLAGGVKIAAGSGHTCALLSSGAGKCWGANQYGQLGDGTHTDRFIPVFVTGLAGTMTALKASSASTCALSTTGGLKCWGRNNRGTVGDGSVIDRATPVNVSGLGSGVGAISIGSSSGHNCAILSGGSIKCWGANDDGQVGNGSAEIIPYPVRVINFP